MHHKIDEQERLATEHANRRSRRSLQLRQGQMAAPPPPFDFDAFTQAMGAAMAQAMMANQAANQPPPAAVPTFVHTPALLCQNLLDYSKPYNIKIYNKSILPLPTVLTKASPNIKVFLDELKD